MRANDRQNQTTNEMYIEQQLSRKMLELVGRAKNFSLDTLTKNDGVRKMVLISVLVTLV